RKTMMYFTEKRRQGQSGALHYVVVRPRSGRGTSAARSKTRCENDDLRASLLPTQRTTRTRGSRWLQDRRVAGFEARGGIKFHPCYRFTRSPFSFIALGNHFSPARRISVTSGYGAHFGLKSDIA